MREREKEKETVYMHRVGVLSVVSVLSGIHKGEYCKYGMRTLKGHHRRRP